MQDAFDLSWNEMGAEGVERLAGVLGVCKALAHLDLSTNQIGAEGAGRLAGVLGDWPNRFGAGVMVLYSN